MQKRNMIVYWISTIWLSLGMVSTGIVQLIHMEEETKLVVDTLGYPEYLLTLLGICKLTGVVLLLLPKFPLIKEWVYAGFFFTMAGAIFSHASMGSAPMDYFGPTLLLVLTVISWYFRPASKKVINA